jgi:hypothetical protein
LSRDDTGRLLGPAFRGRVHSVKPGFSQTISQPLCLLQAAAAQHGIVASAGRGLSVAYQEELSCAITTDPQQVIQRIFD